MKNNEINKERSKTPLPPRRKSIAEYEKPLDAPYIHVPILQVESIESIEDLENLEKGKTEITKPR